MPTLRALCAALGLTMVMIPAAHAARYDLVIRNGMIYDGSGAQPYKGELAIRGDRIAYVGKARNSRGARTIDAKGQAISPGFINMLSHAEEALMVDGRALSDLKQGVTLEVMGEFSMGPLSPDMTRSMIAAQGPVKFPVSWTTLDGYLSTLEKRGIAPNVASFVGAGTVRSVVLGEGNTQPDAAQLKAMQNLVRSAMEEGALGLTAALIYTPDTFAKTPELIALAQESARCGGLYSAHMRSEGDRIEAAVEETIAIAQASGAPAHIYHLKMAGKDNWNKLDKVVAAIEQARASGTRITADMYTYIAGATGLDAAMPPWVQEGGVEAWIKRLRDPVIRKKVLAEMRDPHPPSWENLYGAAGPEGTLLLDMKNPALRPLIGKSLAQVARERGVTPEDAAIDLVIEDGSRVGLAYFLMSEDNVRRQTALPWMSFNSDEGAYEPKGVFLESAAHPRAYGNFARLFAKYVRQDGALSVQEAVRKLTSLPADTLFLADRGRLMVGAYADVAVFDPATIQDHATFETPHRLASGVSHVIVNGKLALDNGAPTGAASGRVVRGRAWRGATGGGCKASASAWK